MEVPQAVRDYFGEFKFKVGEIVAHAVMAEIAATNKKAGLSTCDTQRFIILGRKLCEGISGGFCHIYDVRGVVVDLGRGHVDPNVGQLHEEEIVAWPHSADEPKPW